MNNKLFLKACEERNLDDIERFSSFIRDIDIIVEGINLYLLDTRKNYVLQINYLNTDSKKILNFFINNFDYKKINDKQIEKILALCSDLAYYDNNYSLDLFLDFFKNKINNIHDFKKNILNPLCLFHTNEADFNTVKVLLQHGAEIDLKNNEIFVQTCYLGDLDFIKYLLTSNKLKKHSDINAQDDEGLKIACLNGNIEIVKYLLTSNELKKHSNINTKEDVQPFLCAYHSYQENYGENYYEIMKFLIFEYSFEITDLIKNKLIKDLNNEDSTIANKAKEIMNLFEMQKLNKKLNQEIKKNESGILKKI